MKKIFGSPLFQAGLGALLVGMLATGFLFLEHRKEQLAYDALMAFPEKQDTCRKTFEAKEFTFEYKCSWKVEKNEHVSDGYPTMVLVQTNADYYTPELGNGWFFYVRTSTNFEEYEATHPHVSIVEDTVEVHGNIYPTKLYGQHGGRSYIVDIDGTFIEFGSEDYFYSDQTEWDHVMLILESLEIK